MKILINPKKFDKDESSIGTSSAFLKDYINNVNSFCSNYFDCPGPQNPGRGTTYIIDSNK